MEYNSRTFPIYVVDAFTNVSMSGNPAAVCLVPKQMMPSEQDMQKIGAEMNLSETAFVFPLKDENFKSSQEFSLRWFTPTNEVNLCGHATLASAAVLFQDVGNVNETIHFHTKSGTLSVSQSPNKVGFLAMDLPKNEPVQQEIGDFKDLLLKCVGDLDLVLEVYYSPATKKLLVRLKDNIQRSVLENFKPKSSELLEVDTQGKVKGIGITLIGSEVNGCVDTDRNVYDFVSRYFSPWNGIPEDPVTGSWHTVAGPYWSKQVNKSELYARQCSTRGGDLQLQVKDALVTVMGQAVINLKGNFYL